MLIISSVLLAVWLVGTVVLPMINASQNSASAEATVTPTIRDDLAAHTITIPGKDGERITIRELRTSAIVTGGVATFDIPDHIWYDDYQDFVQDSMEMEGDASSPSISISHPRSFRSSLQEKRHPNPRRMLYSLRSIIFCIHQNSPAPIRKSPTLATPGTPHGMGMQSPSHHSGAFHPTSTYSTMAYNNQVKDYNRGAKHDDAPDSLYGAVQLAQGVQRLRFFERGLLF